MSNRPIGERIAEAIPGTEAYRATQGVTGGHAGVQDMKSHMPGTEEHRMREAGVVGGDRPRMGSATTGTHTGHHGQAGHTDMGNRLKEAIPGTREYEATHGMTQGHRTTEQLKSHIPGTDEHHIRTGMEPGHGMGTTIGTGAHHAGGPGTTGAGLGTDYTGHHGHHQEPGYAGHHTGAGLGGAGAGYNEHGQETVGQKIKKMIPGTEEHKEKKLQEGRI